MVLPGVLVNFELKSWLWHELDTILFLLLLLLLLLFTTSGEIQINANSIGHRALAHELDFWVLFGFFRWFLLNEGDGKKACCIFHFSRISSAIKSF